MQLGLLDWILQLKKDIGKTGKSQTKYNWVQFHTHFNLLVLTKAPRWCKMLTLGEAGTLCESKITSKTEILMLRLTD